MLRMQRAFFFANSTVYDRGDVGRRGRPPRRREGGSGRGEREWKIDR